MIIDATPARPQEWFTGVKLTTLQPEEVRELVKIGQETFLTQLLEVGFIHGDPHPVRGGLWAWEGVCGCVFVAGRSKHRVASYESRHSV